MEGDKENPGIQSKMTWTNLIYHIVSLIYHDVISMKELENFSDERKETVNNFLK